MGHRSSNRSRPAPTKLVVLGVSAAAVMAGAMVITLVWALVEPMLAAAPDPAPPRPVHVIPEPEPEPDEPEQADEPEELDASVSPFTGMPIDEPGPVLAVKIDNAGPARPHTGVEHADIVYVEPVEYGLSRLLAVFSSDLPVELGPVRSARESDIEIVRQFGTPGLAHSGANTTVLDLLGAARLHELSHGAYPGAYRRENSRSAPHNLYLAPDVLLEPVEDRIDVAGDIGFRFGAPPEGDREAGGEGDGRPTERREVGYGSFRIGFTWSEEEERWLIDMDGKPYESTGDERPGPTTVVLQEVVLAESEYRQMREMGSPYVESVGAGRAVVLRDGLAYEVQWSRSDADSGTTFTTPTGEPMTFAPGQVWVVYTDAV